MLPIALRRPGYAPKCWVCATEQTRRLPSPRLHFSFLPDHTGFAFAPRRAGSALTRNRLALETASATVASIGRDQVGIRLSPFGVFNGTGVFPEVRAHYLALAKSLSEVGLLYIHLADHSAMRAPPVPADFKLALRAGFDGLFILCGGFDHASAEQASLDNRGDLVAFGRPFLVNPDLVARRRKDAALNAPDEATFYTPGAKGYIDYPALVA